MSLSKAMVSGASAAGASASGHGAAKIPRGTVGSASGHVDASFDASSSLHIWDDFAVDRSWNVVQEWWGGPDSRRTATEGLLLNVGLVEAANQRFLIEHPVANTRNYETQTRKRRLRSTGIGR